MQTMTIVASGRMKNTSDAAHEPPLRKTRSGGERLLFRS